MLTYKAEKLNEGNDYKFRVIAVNDEGESQPLESMDSIKPVKPAGIYIFTYLIITRFEVAYCYFFKFILRCNGLVHIKQLNWFEIFFESSSK